MTAEGSRGSTGKRTAAAVLGRNHRGAATAGPRPHGGYSVVRRCVAAILGMSLPLAEPARQLPAPAAVRGRGRVRVGPEATGRDILPTVVLAPGPAHRRPGRRSVVVMLASVATAACVAVGLSLSPIGDSAPRDPEDSYRLHQQLPASIQARGFIVVGVDPAQPPFAFTSQGRLVGFDTDLAQLLGAQLRVSFRFLQAPSAQLISGVTEGRYDVVMTKGATEERRKSVTFVNYLSFGSSISVPKDNPRNVRSLSTACGNIAVIGGSTGAELLRNNRPSCATLMQFADASAALAAVHEGRADAAITDFPSAAHAAKGPGSTTEIAGEQLAVGPAGMAVRLRDTELSNTLLDALVVVYNNGSYSRLLEKWGLEDAFLTPTL